MGTLPKPREQRVREGNPGKRRLPEPVLVGGRPNLDELREPPAYLPEDAKQFWYDIVVHLIEAHLIDRVDTPMLEQLAIQYARIRGAQRIIAKTGFFAQGSTGQIKEHPAMKIEREATMTFLRLSDHYGITPLARTRLGLAELSAQTLTRELQMGLGKPDLKPVEVVDAEFVAE